MSQRSETLKIIVTQALNFTHYHMAVDSADTYSGDLVPAEFFKSVYNITEESDTDDIISMKVNDINITSALNAINDMSFALVFSFGLTESTINVINIEVLDLVYSEPVEGNTIYINDFLNGYLKYLFSGIANTYNDFDELGIESSAEKIVIDKNIDMNYILDRGNNVSLSIKTLFLNDMDITYDLTITDELVSKISKYTSELTESINSLIQNNKTTVKDLYEFDDGIVDVNVQAIKTDYADFLSVPPETTKELMQHLILNAIIRSGVVSLSNMLALFDETEYLTLNKIAFSTTLTNQDTSNSSDEENSDDNIIENPDEENSPTNTITDEPTENDPSISA